MVAAGVGNAKRARKYFDDSLFIQRESQKMKEKLELAMKLTSAKNKFIVGIYFHQQYHSPRCWITPGKSFKVCNRLGSETKKLKAMREQIKLRCLGMGFKEAHQPW